MSDSAKKKPWTTPELKRIELTDEILRRFGIDPRAYHRSKSGNTQKEWKRRA
jgi:hypothetical protein